MFTIAYKGFYIHGYFDKPVCRVQFGGTGYVYKGQKHPPDFLGTYKSLHAAKIAITRFISKCE